MAAMADVVMLRAYREIQTRSKRLLKHCRDTTDHLQWLPVFIVCQYQTLATALLQSLDCQ